MLKFYFKAFRTSLFLNCVVYLFHVWHDDRCWSKILCSIIPTLYMTSRSRTWTLNFCLAIFYNFIFFSQSLQWILFIYGVMIRVLSKILSSTIPIPVHGLMVKVTEFEYCVFNFYSVSFCKAFNRFESCLV